MFEHRHAHQDRHFRARRFVNLLYLLVSGYATCFTVFIRRNFGTEALGLNAAVAFIIMMGYTAVHPGSRMGFFVMLWFVMLVAQWLNTMLCRARGIVVHSRYDGYPRLGFAFPFVRAERTAKTIECLACVLIGGLLFEVDQSLGVFVMFGCFGLLLRLAIDDEIDRKRLQRMHDAEIEQSYMMELRQRQRW